MNPAQRTAAIRIFCLIIVCCFGMNRSHAELDTSELAEVKSIFRNRCAECHRAEASSTEFDILDASSLIQTEAVKPGDAEGSLLMQVITSEDEEVRMPMDLPELSSKEIDMIRRWITNGAKSFPEDVKTPEVKEKEDAFAGQIGVEYVLKQILQHQRQQKADHQKYMRYFSCNHLLTLGATRDELNLQRDALAKTINHLSYERDPVQLDVVDGETATVFAVDIRKLGWHSQVMPAVDDFVATKSSLDTYDLILLEYPYGIRYDDSETYDRLVTEFLKPSKMIREIAYLRSDWFCSTTLQPALYHDIMRLPQNVAELERDIVGVDANEDLKHEKVSRGAVILSGVSRNNRAAERYSAPHGAYWKSIDYATNVGDENIFRDPVNLHGVGGEMIFNLPNGLQGYYLATGAGARLDFGPTEIVTDKFAEDKIVRNALSCVRCHDRGMKAFKDVVRPAVEKLPGHLGFSKKQVLALYPEQEELSSLFKKDGDRFMSAMEKVLGHPQTTEPLTPVTRHFLEHPLLLGTVAGELGLENASDMAAVFRSRQFSTLGLIPLASKGAVRRDTWEDYFDQVVRELGLGQPVVPLDAVTRLNYAPLGVGPDITITTTRGSKFFAAGDELAIIVKNNGKLPIFMEMVGTGTKGEMIELVPAGTKLDAASEHRFPSEGTITVKAATGREVITVFASDKEFAAGIHYKGKNTADRYVHRLPASDSAAIVKKSLVIETR